ncbi:MAG: phosphoribosyltransferase [Rhodospirillaceae bacterium]|nr:phosphoribosyltransferase [Rhodospirillaceae bacterium]
MRFQDREDAGRQLAAALGHLRDADCIVYGLPRGGLPVALEVARALRAPLDVILVRKLCAPFNPELALGAVVDGEKPEIVLNQDIVDRLESSAEIIEAAAARELEEIRRRHKVYLCGHHQEQATGRNVIVVDDGLATGATARAALRALRRQNPRRLILAVPVAPREVAMALRAEVDELVCLREEDDFGAVGAFYRSFPQVSDAEVVGILGQWRDELARSGAR